MVDMKAVTHIFFDLDDTLWDFRSNSEKVLSMLFIEHCLGDKLKVPFTDFFEHYRRVNLLYWSRYSKREITKQELRYQRFQETFRHYGYDNYEETIVFTDRYIGLAPYGKAVMSGCHDTLRYLKGKYKLHIITNGFKEIQWFKLNGCGLSGYFSDVIISEEHGLFKPEKEIFRLAESRANVKGSNCVMIGDSYESDVKGALDAGWSALWLNADGEGTHGVIRNLSELRLHF
jgi:putative hydrolase of the HAD superfamily